MTRRLDRIVVLFGLGELDREDRVDGAFRRVLLRECNEGIDTGGPRAFRLYRQIERRRFRVGELGRRGRRGQRRLGRAVLLQIGQAEDCTSTTEASQGEREQNAAPAAPAIGGAPGRGLRLGRMTRGRNEGSRVVEVGREHAPARWITRGGLEQDPKLLDHLSRRADARIDVRHQHLPHERLDTRRNDDASPILDERSEEHTSELQSQSNLVCRLLLEKKKKKKKKHRKDNKNTTEN